MTNIAELSLVIVAGLIAGLVVAGLGDRYGGGSPGAGQAAAGFGDRHAAGHAVIGPLTPTGEICAAAQDTPALPERLSQTGLSRAGSASIRADLLSFSPQYPLWSDGASKRRWLYLPPGTTIDASRPDAWEFPAGTRLWKEFSYGKPVETRLIERLCDGSWRYAAYVWDADSAEASLAPGDGIVNHAVAGAPGGRYEVPSRTDCLACHEGAAVPVLGFSALQLSPDRDPLAPHAEAVPANAIDLPGLVARGLIVNVPPALLDTPPRIEASSPAARGALGYLHGNCGHCHNDAGPLSALDMTLAQPAGTGATGVDMTLGTLIGRASEFRAGAAETRVVRGQPDDSVLALRMRSRNALKQMPPLGTRIIDAQGVALIERWILHDTPNP